MNITCITKDGRGSYEYYIYFVSVMRKKLIQAYISANNLKLPSFICEAALNKIEDDLQLDREKF